MRNLGIKAKIWLSISVFAVGYAVILFLQLWASSQTSAHMAIASGALFPAALSADDAQSGFQKVKQHYNDAILLQDKKPLAAAEADGQALLSSLQSIQDKPALSASLHAQVAALIAKFTDIQARAKPVYTAMIDKPEIFPTPIKRPSARSLAITRNWRPPSPLFAKMFLTPSALNSIPSPPGHAAKETSGSSLFWLS